MSNGWWEGEKERAGAVRDDERDIDEERTLREHTM